MAVLSNTPRDRFPKAGDAHTKQEQIPGTKRVQVKTLAAGQAADLGGAPTSRIYTRDYSKNQHSEQTDLLSPALGNPLRW